MLTSILNAIGLFVGYLAVLASVAIFAMDFPTDTVVVQFLAGGLIGSLLVMKIQSSLKIPNVA